MYQSVDAIGIASGSLSGQNVGENSKKYSSETWGWLRRMRGIFLEQMVTIGTATTAAVIVEAKAVAEVIGAAGTEDTVL